MSMPHVRSISDLHLEIASLAVRGFVSFCWDMSPHIWVRIFIVCTSVSDITSQQPILEMKSEEKRITEKADLKTGVSD